MARLGVNTHSNNYSPERAAEEDMLRKVLLGDLPASYYTKKYVTALHVACRGGSQRAVSHLLQLVGLGHLDPFVLDAGGLSPLAYCCIGDVDSTKCMISLLECLDENNYFY